MVYLILTFVIKVISFDFLLPTLNSTCMTDFVAFNLDSHDITYIIISECYTKIPNYKQLISAYNLKAICYVSSSNFFIHKDGHNITRCGQWLTVTGPSQKSFHCMVVGSAVMFYQNQNIEKNGETVVEVPNNLFLFGTGQLKHVRDSLYQATVSVGDYLAYIKPSLVILNMTQHEAIVQVFNLNKPVEMIGMNYISYIKRKDDTFTLKRPLNSSEIKIISLDFEKVVMPTILEKVGFIATATTSFQHFNMTKCKFIASPLLYSEKHQITNPMLLWYFYRVNYRFQSELLDFIKPVIITRENDKEVMLTMIYGSAFLMSQDFRQLKCKLEVNFTIEIIDIKLMLIANVETAKNSDGFVIVRKNMTYTYKQTNDTVYILIAMDKSCKEFSNGIEIGYKSTPGDVLKLKDTYFDIGEDVQKIEQSD
ncbi:hypothetical protein EIN_136530 [Entamoeba invadens IP1]|uniref:Uncharacterized protein n=1 Tax=Entamoeba invadens IP1 TaxID=370355 RepID=A0A0A1U348_ENTIV|nr:hypothetical protein EIN_136530 [Entamoeba invadens IP1]ELP85979.1 hypothetical protein EIN_136530 [Entamoeba invadens IP1]|eukprot:XP_004185325.1 hypothetical protein EIN_136530 [Entamoeba invadens IP1]